MLIEFIPKKKTSFKKRIKIVPLILRAAYFLGKNAYFLRNIKAYNYIAETNETKKQFKIKEL